MATIPVALKSFTSALRRAEELEKDASNLESQVKTYFLFSILLLTFVVKIFKH